MKYIVFAGTLINLYFTFSYIKAVYKGRIQPNRITWLLWSIAPLIATAAAISNGVGLSVLPVFMSGFTPLLVFMISFTNKNAYWKLATGDYVCGLMSIFALAIWYISKNPNYAILFAIISDGFAAFPTIVKAWKYPETEEIKAFIGGLILATSSFFAIETWNFSALAFPIYLVGLNILMIYAIKHKIKRV